jgi:hypothetical protein
MRSASMRRSEKRPDVTKHRGPHLTGETLFFDHHDPEKVEWLNSRRRADSSQLRAIAFHAMEAENRLR